MNRKPNLAVVGATGVVGTTFLKVLEERNFPFENLYIMASAKSAGKTIEFRGKEYIVEELNEQRLQAQAHRIEQISNDRTVDEGHQNRDQCVRGAPVDLIFEEKQHDDTDDSRGCADR